MANGNIKLNFIHVCDQVILGVDGKITLVNIFDRIKIGTIPIIPKFVIITNISGDLGKYTEKIEIIAPNGDVVVQAQGDAEIREGGVNNFIATFLNVSFSNEGRYKIRVSINGNIIKEENILAERIKK